MVNMKSKIGGALLVIVALTLAWYFFDARESAAKVDGSGGSTDEVDALNKLWLRIRLKLNDLRAQHVKQQIMEDGEVWVGVEVFSEEGDVLRQAFISDVLGMIGEQRGGLFLQGLNAHAAYGRWGKVVGSGFSIRVVEQDDGSLIYRVKEPAKESGVPGRTWRTSRMPEHLKFLSDALEISHEL